MRAIREQDAGAAGAAGDGTRAALLAQRRGDEGIREHPFADAGRSGQQQRVVHATAIERTDECIPRAREPCRQAHARTSLRAMKSSSAARDAARTVSTGAPASMIRKRSGSARARAR